MDLVTNPSCTVSFNLSVKVHPSCVVAHLY